MRIMEILDYLKNILDYQVLGISLKTPVSFLFKALLIFLFIRIILWLINYFYKRSLKRKPGRMIDETGRNFIFRIITTVVYIIGIASVLSLIPPLEKIGSSILASAGIMAMAVGLASQEALSNFVGGIFIILAKPFRIGDFVELDAGVTGTVHEITLRHTVLRSSNNKLIIVPNSKINASIITNSTLGDTATCAFIEVGVSYNENLDRCISVMREEIEKHPLLIDRRNSEEKESGVPKVIIRVMQLGDSSIILRAWAWANTSGEAFVLEHDSLKAIKERFDQENIEIPYPYFNQILMKNS